MVPKYRGLEASELKQVKGLKYHFSANKIIMAELARNKRVSESLIGKAPGLIAKREAADYLVGEEHLPV